MFQKVSGKEILITQRGLHFFLSKLCGLLFSEKPLRETFCVLESFWYRKSLKIRSGEDLSRFSVNVFCIIAKKFARKPISLSLNSGIEKKFA